MFNRTIAILSSRRDGHQGSRVEFAISSVYWIESKKDPVELCSGHGDLTPAVTSNGTYPNRLSRTKSASFISSEQVANISLINKKPIVCFWLIKDGNIITNNMFGIKHDVCENIGSLINCNMYKCQPMLAQLQLPSENIFSRIPFIKIGSTYYN